jgi:hypothetical protein
MKTLNRILFVSLAILFLVSSCTMEKRLYRGGYYVSYKKSQPTPGKQEQKTSEAVAAIEKAEVSTSTAEMAIRSQIRTTWGSKETIKNIPAFSEPAKKEITPSLLRHEFKNTESTKQEIKSSPAFQQKNRSSSTSGDGGGNRALRGLLMLILGLLMFGIGAIFGFAVGGAGGLLLFWLFGLAGTIMIIVGLVMIIVGLATA